MIIHRRSAVRLLGTALISAVLSVLDPAPAPAAEPVTVFAAATLTDVFEKIGTRHQAATGQQIRFSFAASSTLARQIEAGAPAQIFASANEAWIDHLQKAGLIEPGTRVAALGNRLVLIAPADSAIRSVALEAGTDLAGMLSPGERLAIGDPEHVPGGIYAREAMQALGFWSAVNNRLARTSTIPAALALVESGEVPLGVVFATDAKGRERVRVVGVFPETSHSPITYVMAVIAGQDTPAVRSVFNALTGPEARKIYEDAGFIVR